MSSIYFYEAIVVQDLKLQIIYKLNAIYEQSCKTSQRSEKNGIVLSAFRLFSAYFCI